MTRAADVDRGFVETKRKAGIGWSAISRMTGANEADLRRSFDPTVSAEILTMTARAAAPGEVLEQHLKSIGFGADEALIVRRLWLANGACVGTSQLSRGVGGGAAGTMAVSEARRMLRERLNIFVTKDRSRRETAYGLLADDVVALSRAAGLKRGRP